MTPSGVIPPIAVHSEAASNGATATTTTPPDVQHYLRAGSLQLDALPPLSLYVHLPWCLKKCPYCDFNSHELPQGAAPQQRYVDALLADVEAALPLIWGRTVQTIFLGGGTPSLFEPSTMDYLLGALRARLNLQAGCEITLEANPGTFEKDRFKAYHSAGVTRLSLGVQSFNDRHLQLLGRVHDRSQAIAALEEAANTFATFNVDIMYALPEQTLTQVGEDIATALQFAPPHISVYHLTLEPNTYFAKYPPTLPSDDVAYAMLDRITEQTHAAGLERYEVSAYARDAHRCAHNLNYWQFGDYLGIGAGAHSKISFPHRIIRQVRLREPKLYMQQALAGNAVAQETQISRAELPFEFMLNALRLRQGFATAEFMERTGMPLHAIEAALQQAERKGLITRSLTHIRPTALGFDFLSDLQAMFLPESA